MRTIILEAFAAATIVFAPFWFCWGYYFLSGHYVQF